MTPETSFVPWEISPDPAPDVDWDGAKSVKFVDLSKLPPGYIIRFHGAHPVSIYTCLPEYVDDKLVEVRVWLDPSHGSIVGPVDKIITEYWRGPLSGTRRRGVMDTKGTYYMPYFVYPNSDQTEINYAEARMEGYKKIEVQKLPA